MHHSSPSILQILMAVFSDIHYESQLVIEKISSKDLLKTLQKTGLDEKALEKALGWLEKFSELEKIKTLTYQPSTYRTFSTAEQAIIPEACIAFLHDTYLNSEINAAELEFILNQTMLIATQSITEDEFMWIFQMALANQYDAFSETLHAEDITYQSTSLH